MSGIRTRAMEEVSIFKMVLGWEKDMGEIKSVQNIISTFKVYNGYSKICLRLLENM